MKYAKTTAVIAAVLLLLALPAAALSLPAPTERFFVNDFADVLSSETEDIIYAAGVQLFEKTGAQAVAVTVTSLDNASIEDYALNLGRNWGIGDEEKDTGVLLLLAVEEREVRIEVGYGLEGALTDAKTGILLDHYAVPAFGEDDFETGVRDTYQAIVNEVYLEFGMEADPNYVPADELESGNIVIAIGTVVVLIIILLLLSRRGGLFPFFFFGGHSGGFRGGSSGGFGGGGFRGGGGSFGGGGSSRGF